MVLIFFVKPSIACVCACLCVCLSDVRNCVFIFVYLNAALDYMITCSVHSDVTDWNKREY